MPESKNQLLNFVLESEFLERIDNFRFEHRFPSRADAIRWLLNWALSENPNPADPKGGQMSDKDILRTLTTTDRARLQRVAAVLKADADSETAAIVRQSMDGHSRMCERALAAHGKKQ